MNHTVEKLLVPTPDHLIPFFNCTHVTKVIITPVGLTGKISIVAPANTRSAGLILQNGGRIGTFTPDEDTRPIVYYFKGTGKQGYKIFKGQTVLHEGVLDI